MPNAVGGRAVARRGSSRPRSPRALAASSSTRPLHDLDLLVLVGLGSPGSTPSARIEVHVLAAESGRRPERRRARATSPPVRPHSSRSSRFAAASGSSPGSQRRRPAARRARLRAGSRSWRTSQTRCSRVDGDDRDGARMLDDLALVVAPALERHVDELAVVDDARLVGLHAASSATRARSSGAEPRRLAGARVLGRPLRRGMSPVSRRRCARRRAPT